MANRTHQATQHPSAVPGVEAVAINSNHAFPRHCHDHFGIGVIASGAQYSWSGIGRVEARAGDTIMVNPGEMHDGVPFDGQTRAWRMLYLDPALLARETANEVTGEIEIIRPATCDPALARHFTRLFVAVTELPADRLAIEESLVATLMHMAMRHVVRPARTGGSAPSVATAIRRIDMAPDAPITLAELAASAGVSRFQFLRAFARQTGATPHAYLLQRRVRLARALLASGHSPAQAAMQAGFADQSHLTRAFARQFGVTPGRYKAALG